MARGEYIPKLQRQVRAVNAALISAHQGLTDLIAYCQSDKFSTDKTVQVNDIILRCQELKTAMNDKEFEKLNEPLPVKEIEVNS